MIHQNDIMNLTDWSDNAKVTRSQLTILLSITTSIATVILFIMIVLYRHDPVTPPTIAEQKRSLHVTRRQFSIFEGSIRKSFLCDLKIFWEEIKSIFKNRNWRLLLGSFTLINGCIEAFQIELWAHKFLVLV